MPPTLLMPHQRPARQSQIKCATICRRLPPLSPYSLPARPPSAARRPTPVGALGFRLGHALQRYNVLYFIRKQQELPLLPTEQRYSESCRQHTISRPPNIQRSQMGNSYKQDRQKKRQAPP